MACGSHVAVHHHGQTRQVAVVLLALLHEPHRALYVVAAGAVHLRVRELQQMHQHIAEVVRSGCVEDLLKDLACTARKSAKHRHFASKLLRQSRRVAEAVAVRVPAVGEATAVAVAPFARHEPQRALLIAAAGAICLSFRK